MKKYFLAGAMCVGLGAVVVGAPALAEDVFKDKTLTVVVPSGSGGTFHIYCQIVVRHLGRHIPGQPKLIIQNRPGAGGVGSLRYMTSAAPRDGSMIAMINPGTTMTPVLRPDIGYDTSKLQWLGAVSVRTYTLGVWHTVPVKTMADATKMEITLASTSRSATSTTLPIFFNKLLGTKFKVIHGYKGGGAMNLAVERGEVMGRTNYYSGYIGVRPHWLKEKKIRFLATIGPPRAEVADIPRMRDLVPPGINREMLDLLEQNFNVGQAFYVPPGVPNDRVAILRKAFTAMLNDEEMKADAAKRGVPTFTRTWQEVEKAVQVGFNSRKEVQEKLATILGFRKKKK